MQADSPSVVILRPIHADDLPAMFEIHLDPEADRMAVANPRDRMAFDLLLCRIDL